MKEYKCKYVHCLNPDKKIPEKEVVMVGKQRFHKECAELRERVERIKKIYFDYVDDKADYVQVVGVLNNLIFKKKYDVDYVEFMLKYTVVYVRNIKSPYILHTIIKNGIVEKKYNDPKMRLDVIERFDYRIRKG